MRVRHICLFFIGICSAGCANITSPTGGKQDTRPPKLLRVEPGDSIINTRVKRVELYFDEYINLSDVTKEVTLSPMLAIDPQVSGNYKRVVVRIPDTLLEENTTYRLSMGNAIKDVHENNPFSGYTYTFSTGSYFDSLQMQGRVVNAATGLPEADMIVGLYAAAESDSAVVRHRPKYVARTEATGAYVFKGLPGRPFKVYALKDANGNMVYDGPPEMIAFNDEIITPDSTTVNLRAFEEPADSGAAPKPAANEDRRKVRMADRLANAGDGLSYSVNVDTGNVETRTFDVNKPVTISFNKRPTLNLNKISLSYDNAGVQVVPNVTIDTISLSVLVFTDWREDKVYTLGLAKGFAKDSAGVDVMPSRYVFRTKNEDDYGKIQVNVPRKFESRNGNYVLRVMTESDTVYQKPVTDTVVRLPRLKPGTYTFSIIVDKNKNGRWDTGDLFARRQPEEVIPNSSTLDLKAGWENIVDFEEQTQAKKSMRTGADK